MQTYGLFTLATFPSSLGVTTRLSNCDAGPSKQQLGQVLRAGWRATPCEPGTGSRAFVDIRCPTSSGFAMRGCRRQTRVRYRARLQLNATGLRALLLSVQLPKERTRISRRRPGEGAATGEAEGEHESGVRLIRTESVRGEWRDESARPGSATRASAPEWRGDSPPFVR